MLCKIVTGNHLSRYETEQNVEAQYKTILEALIKTKLGVPSKVGDQLVELEPGLKNLVEEASKVWEEGSDYWTQEEEETFWLRGAKCTFVLPKLCPNQTNQSPGPWSSWREVLPGRKTREES